MMCHTNATKGTKLRRNILHATPPKNKSDTEPSIRDLKALRLSITLLHSATAARKASIPGIVSTPKIMGASEATSAPTVSCETNLHNSFVLVDDLLHITSVFCFH